jgi:hypothetical protein
MSTTRRVFPEVFKREAVDRVISSGLPIGKVATELGLNETVLRRWVMRLGGQATGPARRLDAKLARLLGWWSGLRVGDGAELSWGAYSISRRAFKPTAEQRGWVEAMIGYGTFSLLLLRFWDPLPP